MNLLKNLKRSFQEVLYKTFFKYELLMRFNTEISTNTLMITALWKTKEYFEKAKETMKFIKERKWNSAIKSAEKVKDRDFRTLVEWMYLKTTGNSATFNDYKKFIIIFFIKTIFTNFYA